MILPDSIKTVSNFMQKIGKTEIQKVRKKDKKNISVKSFEYKFVGNCFYFIGTPTNVLKGQTS